MGARLASLGLGNPLHLVGKLPFLHVVVRDELLGLECELDGLGLVAAVLHAVLAKLLDLLDDLFSFHGRTLLNGRG